MGVNTVSCTFSCVSIAHVFNMTSYQDVTISLVILTAASYSAETRHCDLFACPLWMRGNAIPTLLPPLTVLQRMPFYITRECVCGSLRRGMAGPMCALRGIVRIVLQRDRSTFTLSPGVNFPHTLTHNLPPNTARAFRTWTRNLPSAGCPDLTCGCGGCDRCMSPWAVPRPGLGRAPSLRRASSCPHPGSSPALALPP